ncbi:S1 family peptidase, partial [Streptomyces sp. NPDC058398]|uniref:S1 family peptidase n=1 Tax=Streptomyces sp. NPDC058398 TaxID=3346479 RepID=UPI003660667A
IDKDGAVANHVKNSTDYLRAAAQTLKADATVPGTAWSVDPKTNEIRVSADSTVTGDKWNTVESTVKNLGSGVATLTKSAGTLKTFVDGGDAIFGGNARCSLGFNVTAGDGTPAFLTAGHCGVAAAEWSDAQGGAPIATVDQATFPGAGDFSLVKYDDPATQANSAVNVGNGQSVQINQAVEAAVGQQVFRMGSTTGLHDGNVTGLNATVNYPEGTVTGLIQTDVCAEPGDSGGSLFTQDGGAVGLTSGGSGDCTAGGETFFQPVTTALEAVGATLGAGDAGAGAGDAGAGGAVDPSAGAVDPGAGDAVDPSAGAVDPGTGEAVDPSASASDAAGAGTAQNGTHHRSRKHHSSGASQ